MKVVLTDRQAMRSRSSLMTGISRMSKPVKIGDPAGRRLHVDLRLLRAQDERVPIRFAQNVVAVGRQVQRHLDRARQLLRDDLAEYLSPDGYPVSAQPWLRPPSQPSPGIRRPGTSRSVARCDD
jgi:hypothetical protein